MVYSKSFSRDEFFVFWGTRLVGRFLSYLPVKQIWRKSAVCGRPPHYSPLHALAHRCLWRRLPKHSVIIQAGLVICSRRSFFLPLKLPFILLFWPPLRMGAAPAAAARRAVQPLLTGARRPPVSRLLLVRPPHSSSKSLLP